MSEELTRVEKQSPPTVFEGDQALEKVVAEFLEAANATPEGQGWSHLVVASWAMEFQAVLDGYW